MLGNVLRATSVSSLFLLGVAGCADGVAPPAVTEGISLDPQSTSCFGDGCNGKDPKEMDCDADVVSADTVTKNGVTIDLRWSAACGANWALITPAHQGAQFRVENSAGHSWTETVEYDSPTWFGMMVNGSNATARACFPNGVCTAWH